MSEQPIAAVTAGIKPDKFADRNFFTANRSLLIFFLIIITLGGFALRVHRLGAESLSEDELNKLQTVADYRANGLSGRNGEHPFLMKGLQLVSISASEKWNSAVSAEHQISDEFALRLPTAVIGTLMILAIFLLVNEMFGTPPGLISAALWAFEPTAIAFDRVAKEDSFLIFFFLLTNFFWLRGQTKAERGEDDWFKYTLLAAAAFAALMASKYLPHLLGIGGAYYYIFQTIPATKWRLGKTRWLTFFAVAGVCFLVFNPTILLPETWHEMLKFSGEKRIGHDSTEFMGALYQNKLTAWLNGVPWTFYYVFILVKTSLAPLIFALAGLPLLFKKRLGDGRYFLLFWAFMWFLPFSVLGGKFARYFSVAEPLVLISSAVGFYFAVRWLTEKIFLESAYKFALQIVLFAALLASSVYNSLTITPHFRLFTNTFGGGAAGEGFYFPHDEFYDTSVRETVAAIIPNARQNAVVASETPGLFEYYAVKAGRSDLKFISLSDQEETGSLTGGDFIVAAKGRRYFSNDAYLKSLEQSAAPVAEIKIDDVSSVKIYKLEENG